MNTEYKSEFARSCLEGLSINVTSDEAVWLIPQYLSLIEEDEVGWGKDVASVPGNIVLVAIDRIAELVDTSRCSGIYTHRDLAVSITKVLHLYKRWCSANKDIHVENLFFTRYFDEAYMQLRAIQSPDRLRYITEQFYEPVSVGSASCRAVAAVWLLYSGLTQYEIMHLTKDDVPKSGNIMTIERGGRKVLIPLAPEAVNAVKKLAASDTFTYWHPVYGETRKARSSGEYIMRGAKAKGEIDYSSEKSCVTAINNVLRDHKKSVGEIYCLAPTNLFLNGCFYRAANEEAVLASDGVSYAVSDLKAIRNAIGMLFNGRLGNKARHSESQRTALRLKIITQYKAWKRMADKK